MLRPVKWEVNTQIGRRVQNRTGGRTLPGNVDRRVRRTRDAIHRAFIGLMQERGYDGVTVTDIIERADIGRSTFYAHYTDKRDVLHATLDELAEFLRRHRDGSGELFGFSRALFEHVHEQRPLLRALLGRRGGSVVQARIAQLIGELVHEQLHGRATDVSRELVVDCVVGAFTSLLARWVDEQEPHTPAQMDEAFHRLISPGVLAVLGPPGSASA
jgi:AcrR family transcriptional regulator